MRCSGLQGSWTCVYENTTVRAAHRWTIVNMMRELRGSLTRADLAELVNDLKALGIE